MLYAGWKVHMVKTVTEGLKMLPGASLLRSRYQGRHATLLLVGE